MNLSAVLLGMGRAEEALPLAQYCVEITSTLSNRANGKQKQKGQMITKSKLHKQQNNANNNNNDNDGNNILRITALHNLAVTLAQQPACSNETQQEALAMMLRAFREAQLSLGEMHPTTLMLRTKCGMTE